MADQVDPMRAYTEARQKYVALRSETVAKLMPIYRIPALLRSHPHAVLASKFGLPLDVVAFPPPKEFRFEMKDWPDAVMLMSWLTELHGAFLTMRSAWSALSNEDRRMLAGSAPPDALSLMPA